jgi:hypothetical protein
MKKCCSQCKQMLETREFDLYARPRKRDGVRAYKAECRLCSRQRVKRLSETKKNRAEIPLPSTKVCRACFVEKSSAEFIQQKRNLDGLYSYCKTCHRQQAITKRKQRPERHSYQRLRAQAKATGKAVEISSSTFLTLLNLPCTYCQRPYVPAKDFYSYWLDRIDNSRGYSLDNILPCCGFCNRLRRDDLTVEETKVAVKAILALRTQGDSTPAPSPDSTNQGNIE